MGDTRGGCGEQWWRTEQWARAQVESRGQHSHRNNFQKFSKEALGAVTDQEARGGQAEPEKVSRSKGGDVVNGRFA